MFCPLLAGVVSGMLGFLMAGLSLFLILLVLVQRGKGGGLAGALGGPGGQSAFGSKAGDTFTWITVAVASIWGVVCALAMLFLGTHAPSVADETSLTSGPGDKSPAAGLVVEGDESLPAGGLEMDSNDDDVSGDLVPIDVEPADVEPADTADTGASVDTVDAIPSDADTSETDDTAVEADDP